MNIVSISLILVSILLLIAGYIIRKRKMPHLIAGYDPNEVQDKEKYIKWATGNIFVVAIAGLLSGVLMSFMPDLTMHLVAAYIIVVGLLALVMVIGEKRYKRR